MDEPDMGYSASDKYARTGHPSIQELVAEQGTKFRTDPAELLGDFWPEEESIEDFLRALHEWRGHDSSESRFWVWSQIPRGAFSDLARVR